MVGPQSEPREQVCIFNMRIFYFLILFLSQAAPYGHDVVLPSPLPAFLPANTPMKEILVPGGTKGTRMSKPEAHVLSPNLANYLAALPLNMDLLASPEAEELLVGLNSGNNSLENILQRLTNPALQVSLASFYETFLNLFL